MVLSVVYVWPRPPTNHDDTFSSPRTSTVATNLTSEVLAHAATLERPGPMADAVTASGGFFRASTVS